jgi:hypothetical protein
MSGALAHFCAEGMFVLREKMKTFGQLQTMFLNMFWQITLILIFLFGTSLLTEALLPNTITQWVTSAGFALTMFMYLTLLLMGLGGHMLLMKQHLDNQQLLLKVGSGETERTFLLGKLTNRLVLIPMEALNGGIAITTSGIESGNIQTIPLERSQGNRVNVIRPEAVRDEDLALRFWSRRDRNGHSSE